VIGSNFVEFRAEKIRTLADLRHRLEIASKGADAARRDQLSPDPELATLANAQSPLLDAHVNALVLVTGWLELVDDELRNRGVEGIKYVMTYEMLRVHDPRQPNLWPDQTEPVYRWLQTNQRVWNRVIRNIIQTHISMETFRRVIEQDLRVPDQMEAGRGPYGDLMLKSNARALLAEFATNPPSWC
jgi:hypothetical protein